MEDGLQDLEGDQDVPLHNVAVPAGAVATRDYLARYHLFWMKAVIN
jgi:hypothetical protein